LTGLHSERSGARPGTAGKRHAEGASSEATGLGPAEWPAHPWQPRTACIGGGFAMTRAHRGGQVDLARYVDLPEGRTSFLPHLRRTLRGPRIAGGPASSGACFPVCRCRRRAAGRPGLHRTPCEQRGDAMSLNLAACVRVTTRRSAVWRECAGCTALAPLAPDETHCCECRTAPARRTGRTRTRHAA
jgi:hypothetical protein